MWPFLVRSLFVLGLLTVLTVYGEKHSLTYIYTALSPSKLPSGIHQFTAIGLLDDKIIDYFDSVGREKVSRQQWMKSESKEYWVKGTQSRQSKMKWFQVNIKILMERMRQNESDIHVLQWLHGCEAKINPDGELKFSSGLDKYSYDGQSFLSFDDDNLIWVSINPAAMQTKRKWNDVPTLKEYTKGYLEKECVDWMKKFLGYEQKQLEAAPSPEVYLFAKNSNVKNRVVLTCLASGFVRKDVTLQMRRDGDLLTPANGVMSSGVRPNDDDTFQRRDWVEIWNTDMSTLTCVVTCETIKCQVQKVWDHTLLDESGPLATVSAAVGVVFLVLVVGGIVGFVLYRKRKGNAGKPESTEVQAVAVLIQAPPTLDAETKSVELNPLISNKTDGSKESVCTSGSDSGVSTDADQKLGAAESDSAGDSI